MTTIGEGGHVRGPWSVDGAAEPTLESGDAVAARPDSSVRRGVSDTSSGAWSAHLLDSSVSSLRAGLEARLPEPTDTHAAAAPVLESWVGTSASLGEITLEAENDKGYAGGRLASSTDLQITRLTPKTEALGQAIRDQFQSRERDGSDSLLLREPETGAYFVVAADEIKNIKSLEVGKALDFSFVGADGQVRTSQVVVEGLDDERDGGLEGLRKKFTGARPDERPYKVLGSYDFKAAANFTPSVGAVIDTTKFERHEKTYEIPHDFETAWAAYTGITPDKAWPGPSSTFQRAYTPADNRWREKDAKDLGPIQPGNIYFLDLKIAGLMTIPVGFQITQVSKENKTIEFTYLEQNVSHGRQTLQFVEKDGKTELVHTSYFSSGKEFRDKHLYPFFHERLIDDFHANLLKQM